MVGLQIDEEKSFYCTGKQFHCLGYTIDQYGPELPESTLVRAIVQPERRTHPAKSDSLQHFRACGYLHVNAGRHERFAECCRRVMMAYDRDMSLLTYGRIFEEFRHLPNRIWQQSPDETSLGQICSQPMRRLLHPAKLFAKHKHRAESILNEIENHQGRTHLSE